MGAVVAVMGLGYRAAPLTPIRLRRSFLSAVVVVAATVAEIVATVVVAAAGQITGLVTVGASVAIAETFPAEIQTLSECR